MKTSDYLSYLDQHPEMSLREFVLICAAVKTTGAPLPATVSPELAVIDDRIAHVRARLAEIVERSPAEIATAHEAECVRMQREHAAANVEREKKRVRYKAMLNEGRAWANGPEHYDLLNIKAFVLRQLEQGLRDAQPVPMPNVVKQDPLTAYADELASCRRTLVYWENEREATVRRAEELARWFELLRASLPEVP